MGGEELAVRGIPSGLQEVWAPCIGSRALVIKGFAHGRTAITPSQRTAEKKKTELSRPGPYVARNALARAH